MAHSLANHLDSPSRHGDIAHPPRWAAILDLCPKAAWPPRKALRQVYLLHIDDGERILLWGRLVFSDLSESVGFVSGKLERRLKESRSKCIQWLSRVRKTGVVQKPPKDFSPAPLVPHGPLPRKPPKKAHKI